MNAQKQIADTSLLKEIDGYVREDGKFVVTHWPGMRNSYPNFLSELVLEMEAEAKRDQL